MTPIPVVLASASPRRRELLERIGIEAHTAPAYLDETPLPGEGSVAHVERLALAKARAVAAEHPDALVIGGDTVVVLDGDLLAKPVDEADAVAMLLRLQGRAHRVETAIAVVTPDGRSGFRVVGADVRFRSFDRDRAEGYVATGEPMDKAGAYGIQGYGSVLVESIAGDYFAVMGLPVSAVVELLESLGYVYTFEGRILHRTNGFQ